ncbi:MAG: hypothetical protein WC788_06135 [Candidatus Paceibacterota bacterium]
MNGQKNYYETASSLFSGFIVAIIVIICYYAAFSFGYLILGSKHYIEVVILMVIFSISTGASYPLLAKGSAKGPIAMIAFFLTLYAMSRLINIFEIHLFVIITIIAAALVKILIWSEILKKHSSPKNLS